MVRIRFRLTGGFFLRAARTEEVNRALAARIKPNKCSISSATLLVRCSSRSRYVEDMYCEYVAVQTEQQIKPPGPPFGQTVW